MLLSCVQCPMGELLTNGNVIEIFQACFRIGHYQTERSKGMTGSLRSPIWGLALLPSLAACQRITTEPLHTEPKPGIFICLHIPSCSGASLGFIVLFCAVGIPLPDRVTR